MALDPARALTQYQSRNWGPEDGLPCNNILSVTQTADGYMWLGTEEGLARFDGVRTQIVERQTHQHSQGNNISEVLEDARRPGSLLFVSSTGSLGRFANGQVEAWSQATASIHQPGQVLVQNPVDGALWVGTVHGLYRVGMDGEVTSPVETSAEWPAEPINTLCRDKTGRLWVGCARGIYRQREPGDGRHFDLLANWKGGEVDCIASARGGGLWIGSRTAGIGRLDENAVFHPRAALAGCVVTSLLEDRDGILWAGTFGSGLYRLLSDGTTKAGKAVAALTTVNGLRDNQVNGLCEDREGDLWLATGTGVQVLRDARFATFGVPEGLPVDDAVTVFEDRRGRLWIGTDAGLSMLNSDRDQITNYQVPPSAQRPSDNLVLSLGSGDDDETLLVGTHAGLLRRRNEKLEPWLLRDDLDGSAVRAFCVDAAGNRWVGTNNGLFELRNEQVMARLTTTEGLANNVVRALQADKKGVLWIATDGGLSRRETDGRITNFLTAGVGHILCITEAPGSTGDIFVGTEFGLYRLHTGTDDGIKITVYTTRDGLFDNSMWSLIDDSRGNLWMSSNKGIARIAWSDLDRFDRKESTAIHSTIFGTRDGLRSRETNGGHQPTAWRDHLGMLWFATVKGAVEIDPSGERGRDPLPPPVRVEELAADGHPVPFSAGSAPPELPADTQKFELRYTALSLTAPESNRFRYRLEPFEARWTEAGTERVAHYTNLPPGHYRFLVQAANADGVWNETGAVLAFTLLPHFYQIIWFQLLAVGTTLGLGLFWLRLHKRHLVARVVKAEADVRERIRYQKVLSAAKEDAERATAQAERANLAKSEFLSRMSHELRTPLNAILGFAQLLELDDLTAEQGSATRHILKGGRHLLELINEVLDLARVEAGHMSLSPEPVNAGEVFQESLDLVAPLARQRNLQIESQFGSGSESWVIADRQRLKQILVNLLSNAVKFNRESGRITATCKPVSADLLRLCVRDTGPGIAPADQERIFSAFERLAADRAGVEGTGLGLALAKRLTELMGGSITVESILGEGSVFCLDLPRAVAPEMALSPMADFAPLAAAGEPMRSVLYIEDNIPNLDLVERILEKRPGLRLIPAIRGDLGLRLAKQHHPDLILLDLDLPDLDGREVLRRLRADPLTQNTPVIVVSANALPDGIEQLLAAGADAYVTKPIDVRDFFRVLDEQFKSNTHHV